MTPNPRAKKFAFIYSHFGREIGFESGLTLAQARQKHAEATAKKDNFLDWGILAHEVPGIPPGTCEGARAKKWIVLYCHFTSDVGIETGLTRTQALRKLAEVKALSHFNFAHLFFDLTPAKSARQGKH